MTGKIQMPARRWGDEDEAAPAVAPVVVVSSRDNASVPTVPAALRLLTLARTFGWSARLTYAEALVAEQHYLNGRLKKPAHTLATVALRLARGDERGYAVWSRESYSPIEIAVRETTGPWRFAHAYIGPERHGARSIVDRLTVTP